MRQKIILSLFALFVFLAIGTITAVVYMSSNTGVLKNIIMLHEVEQLRRSLVIKIQNVQADLYTVDTDTAPDLDFIVHEAMDLDQTAKKCSSCHHEPKLTERIEAVQSLVKDYEEALSYYLTARANENLVRNMKIEAARVGKELIMLTGAMSHSASMSLAELTEDSMKRMNSVMTILVITIAITFLLGIGVAINLTKSVTQPINELVQATRKISSGEYGSTISYSDKTEFGELARNFNIMSTAIKEGYEKLQREVSDRRDAEDALRLSEERLQTVFNQMQEVFYRTDEEDRIIWVSPSAVRVLGFNTVDELNGLNFSKLCSVPEKRRLFLDELYDKGKVANFEMEMSRKDKREIVVSINSHFYLDSYGKVAGIEGSIRDITERKRYEEEHRKIEKLESVGILAGGIAHDFNNLLTTIIGNVTLAKSSLTSESSEYGVLSDAEEACRRAKDLTTQLLTFSKGGQPVKTVSSVKKLMLEAARFALRGSNINYEFKIPDELWAAEIDEGQINQVLYNLFINANHAMPDGGMVSITAENLDDTHSVTLALKDSRYIKITIRDTGTGIAEENLPRIFDPYFTTKEKGSGLGLSSAYSIIKNHNGSINVESESGKGTTFTIYLPAYREVVDESEKKTDKVIEGAGKILLMDDELTVRQTIEKMLTQLGYGVAAARDGNEALTLYREAQEKGVPFDAVIMDLTIRGGLGGEETIKELLKIDPDVKAIVSSGYSSDTIMANYNEYGFIGVISKPFDIQKVSELLHDTIHNHKGQT